MRPNPTIKSTIMNKEEMSDFLDDTVYDDKGLPPNPYLTKPVKYPRGLERVIRKIFLL